MNYSVLRSLALCLVGLLLVLFQQRSYSELYAPNIVEERRVPGR